MSRNLAEAEFGYYPSALPISIGDIEVQTLPGLEQIAAAVARSDGVDADWIYAPAQRVRLLGGGIEQKPYASRVFGLPKTHVVRHFNANGGDHLAFLIWALSFFVGMRLTTTEAGYLDATPITPGKLVDFVVSFSDLPKVLTLADTFWAASRAKPARVKRFIAVVHALFLGQKSAAFAIRELHISLSCA